MKKEIAILAAVALGSMLAGFLLVFLILGPRESATLPDPFADGSSTSFVPEGPGGAGGEKEEPASGPPPAGQPEPAGQPVEEPPEEPPPPQPATGKLSLAVGDPFIWRCWAQGAEDPHEKERCGELAGVDMLVSENLGLVERCVLDHAGAGASGKLSLALKLDYGSGSVNAWLGNSTTVAEMESISACLRSAYETKLPPPVAHDYQRYIVFFTIEVG